METVEHNGVTYRVRIERDYDMGAPWEEHDGHGIVSEWTSRSKYPGERILAEDRGKFLYYDFAESCRKAREERWDAEPFSTTETPRQRAAKAANADYLYLRAWNNHEWYWCGVVVTSPDGETASLWGCSSEDESYLLSVAVELAEELSLRPRCEHCGHVLCGAN